MARKVLVRNIHLVLFATLVVGFVSSLASAQDYSKFLHTSSKHASIGCNDCHRRAENSSRPNFPGHKACTGCHLTQFTTPNIPMCSICHSSVNGNDPPRKAFPDRFNESFNMKFDHAQHMTGAARPKNGCASCHGGLLRRGTALSIPAGINAHNVCYTCHTPNAQANGRDLASCGVCHETRAYSRTSTNAVAFSYGFAHSDHSTRQRLNCSDCHSYTRGLPQKRQVVCDVSQRPAVVWWRLGFQRMPPMSHRIEFPRLINHRGHRGRQTNLWQRAEGGDLTTGQEEEVLICHFVFPLWLILLSQRYLSA
jgi:hypothetical protein